MRPMTSAMRTKITTEKANAPKIAARTSFSTGRTVWSRTSSTSCPTFSVSCAAQSSLGAGSEDMPRRLAVSGFREPIADAHAAGPGVGPDYRAYVVDEDLLAGIYTGEHAQEDLEIRCSGMCHRQAVQLASLLQLVDEVFE